MTRRCKPGQRARIIDGSKDNGKIVLVVRYYFGEEVSGATWPDATFPWVVASLSGPLVCFEGDTGRECLPEMVLVMDDCDLKPLPGDDDSAESTDLAVRPPALSTL